MTETVKTEVEIKAIKVIFWISFIAFLSGVFMSLIVEWNPFRFWVLVCNAILAGEMYYKFWKESKVSE